MELKKILFVINTLGQGGAEVALIELIKELPRLTDCTIDLYVMLGQGELIDSIPPYVNVLNKKMDPTDVLSTTGRKRLYRHTLAKLLSRFSGLLRSPENAVNNVYFEGKKRASFQRSQYLRFRINE